MALTPAKLKKLEAKRASDIISTTGEINFQDKIELSAQSEPLSGVLTDRGKTKGQNFRYILTCDQGSFYFYSKTALDVTKPVEDHSFGIQTHTVVDGVKVELVDDEGNPRPNYWY
jgi:hypothetical protein